MYKLQRLEMINYKVFENKMIEFNSDNLFVLDGPNGYGKTSIFEAIEIALTGTISRIEYNASTNGNQTYKENVISNSPEKDVIIKLFLSNGKNKEESLEIIREIKAEVAIGKHHNPKQLSKQIKGTILKNGKCILKNGDNDATNEELSKILEIDIKEYFSKLHYISQEDRLSFLQESESNRKNIINHLINVEKEMEEQERYAKLYRKLNSIKNNMIEKVKELERNGKNVEINNSNEPYVDLFTKENISVSWNEKEAIIENEEILKSYMNQLFDVYKFKKEYIEDDEWNKLLSKTLDDKEITKAYLKVYFNGGLEKVKKEKEILNFILNEKSKDPEKMNYKQIMKTLELNFDLEKVQTMVEEYTARSKTLAAFEDNLKRLKETRQSFLEIAKSEKFLAKGKCHNCGYDWKSNEVYEQELLVVEESLEQLSSVDVKNIERIKKEIENFYIEYIKESLDKIEKYVEYSKGVSCNDVRFEEQYNKSVKVFEFAKFPKITLKNLNTENMEDYLENTFKKIEELKRILPENIEKHIETFKTVYRGDMNIVRKISKEEYDNKKKYLQQQYNNYLINKNEEAEKQLEKLRKDIENINTIIGKINEIVKIFKNEINNHYNEILSSIKIPVFLYTGRVLQNFKGGLGITVESITNDDNGLNAIRFSSEHTKSHDILYTLSSGQLSGFIIAFTLVMNKVYGTPAIKSILIDDPVQTMDDLNIVALTEILRNDFRDYQIVISTHEEKFSKYIKYRFHKAGLEVEGKSMLELLK